MCAGSGLGGSGSGAARGEVFSSPPRSWAGRAIGCSSAPPPISSGTIVPPARDHVDEQVDAIARSEPDAAVARKRRLRRLTVDRHHPGRGVCEPHRQGARAALALTSRRRTVPPLFTAKSGRSDPLTGTMARASAASPDVPMTSTKSSRLNGLRFLDDQRAMEASIDLGGDAAWCQNVPASGGRKR